MARRRALALLGGIALAVAGCQALRGSASDARPGAGVGPASSLAVDPSDGTVLKVGRGVFRGSASGQRWENLAVPPGLHPDKLTVVATTSAAPTRLFAAGPGAGVLRSDDRGQSWRAIGTALPGPNVAALAVHTVRPDTLYAWIDGKGVFRSEDGGARWQRMDDGPPARVRALAHSPLEGSMNTGWLYAGTSAGPYLSMDCF